MFLKILVIGKVIAVEDGLDRKECLTLLRKLLGVSEADAEEELNKSTTLIIRKFWLCRRWCPKKKDNP
ncbi:hypothetical protein Sjap_008145 [Stephania japonica]|uniref:Uncharacterized protein n=1 Tax=Stephania japonica TaxID=461633 RepID=A0AAP0JPS7_9MAGN